MGSIFGPVLTNLGQIIIKVNVEILMLKVTMFNLDSLEKGAFYSIHATVLWYSGVFQGLF